MNKSRFLIVDEMKTNAINPLNTLDPVIRKKLDVRQGAVSSSKSVCILPTALSILREHIGWGQETAHNQVEQGGLLVGRIYQDTQEDSVNLLGVVYQVLPGLTEGSMKHLHFSHETWADMLNEYDKLTTQPGWEDIYVIGWYHTHPKHLKVYMSETDIRTQVCFFGEPWHISVIINPQQQVVKAYLGKNAEECPIFLFSST